MHFNVIWDRLPLDGTMTCVVTDLGNNTWQGRFHGVWHGQEFSYTVRFSGPPERLRGRAVIDGADYEWAGEMTADSLNGRFGGNRYNGSFSLKKKTQETTAATPLPPPRSSVPRN